MRREKGNEERERLRKRGEMRRERGWRGERGGMGRERLEKTGGTNIYENILALEKRGGTEGIRWEENR